MVKILVTGSDGRFGKTLRKVKTKYKFIFKDKKELNILSKKSIVKNIKKFKPLYILHLAGLSRPMKLHDTNIYKSIDLNIIGTCNLVKEASKKNIKFIYLSTNYVYQGNKGNYKETDPLKPWNNYGWSKLGGECAAQMYKNSLIVRMCMTEKPFIHKKAYANVKSNFIFQEEAAELLLKIIKKKGIINLGEKVKVFIILQKNIIKKLKKYFLKRSFQKIDMNLNKLKSIIKK